MVELGELSELVKAFSIASVVFSIGVILEEIDKRKRK